MSNLLDETKEFIKRHDLSTKDIIYIGSDPRDSSNPNYSCTWEQFIKLANFRYDDGYGSQEVAADLIIVFENGQYMQRDEYDGSERWILIKPLVIPTNTRKIKTLKGGSELFYLHKGV